MLVYILTLSQTTGYPLTYMNVKSVSSDNSGALNVVFTNGIEVKIDGFESFSLKKVKATCLQNQ